MLLETKKDINRLKLKIIMKLILEQDKCIGCSACAALDPKNFKMKGTKTTLTNSKETEPKIFEKEAENTTESQDATDSCPVQCIIKKN